MGIVGGGSFRSDYNVTMTKEKLRAIKEVSIRAYDSIWMDLQTDRRTFMVKEENWGQSREMI